MSKLVARVLPLGVVLLAGTSVLAAAGCMWDVHGEDYGPPLDAGKADSGTPHKKDTSPEPEDTGTPPEDTSPPEDTAPEDTGTPEDTRVPDTDPYPDTGDPCNDCVYGKCSTEVSDCFADTMCKGQMDCLAACTDSTCADKCAKDYPSTKVDPLMTCVSTKCGTACGGP